MSHIKKWISSHPGSWQFIKFNIFANFATVANFVSMWIFTTFIFKGLSDIPFKFWLFDYTTPESLMLTGFISFLLATTIGQIVNYIVQRKVTFKSNADFSKSIPKYIVMVIAIVIISTALPGKSQEMLAHIGLPESILPFGANLINLVVQVVISFTAMKYFILPEDKSKVQVNVE
ncbi:MAG: GtrA family protein [Butyrivibrio sp.]|nr:GtrA family protein [Butyrivibrio sp.]